MIQNQLLPEGHTTPMRPTLAATQLAGQISPYAVTHAAFDSETGWLVELARPSHLTDGAGAPSASDLPDDVRSALIAWLVSV